MDELKVTLHDNLVGALRFGQGKFELGRLRSDGSPAKVILSTDLRNLLQLHLAPAPISDPSAPATSHKIPSTGPTDDARKLYVSTLAQKGHLRLLKLDVAVPECGKVEAEAWIARAMRAAYPDTKPKRKVLLLVNPVGGKGKARSLVDTVALPILQAAGCDVEIMETKYEKHAEEIARTAPLDYDVIAAASGDGLIHEVLNGFAARPNARKALRIPIAPIPTGSANGLCVNLLGPEDTFNIPLACLNVIKGKAMPLDLCAVTRGEELRWSFMSVAAGLMCDVDLGTENLRWLGDARFFWGFFKGIASNRPMQCKISCRVVSSDKGLMIQQLNARRDATGRLSVAPAISENGDTIEQQNPAARLSVPDEGEDDSLPPVKELVPDNTWITIESGTRYETAEKMSRSKSAFSKGNGLWEDGVGVLYVYAGMMPYVARDLMQFPVSMPGEGVVDIVVQSLVPRAVLTGAITGAEKGKQFYLSCQHYYKATAFCIEPVEAGALVSVDGEAMPFEKLSVEVHARLANTLSLVGGWADGGFGR